MKESAVYQEILQEGRQEGLLEGKLKTIPLLTKLGLTIAEISEELDLDVALVNQFVANQNHQKALEYAIAVFMLLNLKGDRLKAKGNLTDAGLGM